MPNDFLRLQRQRHDVRRDVGETLTLFLGELLAWLEPDHGNEPQASVQIELVLGGVA